MLVLLYIKMIYIYQLFFRFLSHLGHQRALSRVPCATQQVLISYLFYVCMLSLFSHVQLFAAPWPVVCQAPLSMGFFKPQYCSGLPCPPPGNLPNQRIKPKSHISCIKQAGSLPLAPPEKPHFVHNIIYVSPNLPIHHTSSLSSW